MQTYVGTYATLVLEAFTGEILPAQEALVRLAAEPLWRAQQSTEQLSFIEGMARRYDLVTSVLRTGGVFVFDREDIPQWRVEPSAELPPLPFPRTWVEIAGAHAAELQFRDLDGRVSFVLGFAIAEEERGQLWHVCVVMIDKEHLREHSDVTQSPEKLPPEALAIREYEFRDNGAGQIVPSMGSGDRADFEAMTEDERMRLVAVKLLPEYLVQLLHVLGAKQETVPVPRGQRRAFERRHGVEHPTVYRVNLRSAGEEHGSGGSDRQFYHRWIVRGHYRKHPSGEHFLPKGPCTWVRPHVKGPKGAPWKGRPVYATSEAA